MADFKQIRVRRDSLANWTGVVPANGEPIGVIGADGLATSYKIGDGVTAAESLPALSKGDRGDKGGDGTDGLPGTNAIPSDNAVAAYLSATGRSASWAALREATTAFLGEPLPPVEAAADPFSGNETLSPDFRVVVGGTPVFVHVARVQDAPFAPADVGFDAGGAYSFVNFTAPADTATTIEVQSATADLARADLITRRPDLITNVERQQGRLRFTLAGPAKIVLQHNGNRFPLMLFGNPAEAPIDPADPNVIYFGPGYHQPSGIVRVTAGETLYLDQDAVLKGCVSIDGDNAAVRGRGIISGDHMPHGQGAPATLPLLDVHGNNATIEGITLRGGPTWTLPSWHVTGTTISNVKIVNGRVQNDDGIGFINSTGGRVSDCFIRSDDDCLTVKGTNASEAAGDNQWTDMTLWTDRGRIILIGHESKASSMDALSLTDTLIVRTGTDFYPLLVQPGDELLVSNLTIARVTLLGSSQYKLLQVQTAPTGTTSTSAGNVKGVTVTELTVTGRGGVYATDIRGTDATHTVQDVSISKLTLNDTKITAAGPALRIGANTSTVTIA